MIYKNGYLAINSNVWSTKFRSADLSLSADMQDSTLQGQNTKSSVPGLKQWQLTVEFGAEFINGGVEELMFALWGADAFPIEVRPDAGAVASTNPKFTGNAVLATYNVIKGSVGQYMTLQAVFNCSGDLSRAEV